MSQFYETILEDVTNLNQHVSTPTEQLVEERSNLVKILHDYDRHELKRLHLNLRAISYLVDAEYFALTGLRLLVGNK